MSPLKKVKQRGLTEQKTFNTLGVCSEKYQATTTIIDMLSQRAAKKTTQEAQELIMG